MEPKFNILKQLSETTVFPKAIMKEKSKNQLNQQKIKWNIKNIY